MKFYRFWVICIKLSSGNIIKIQKNRMMKVVLPIQTSHLLSVVNVVDDFFFIQLKNKIGFWFCKNVSMLHHYFHPQYKKDERKRIEMWWQKNMSVFTWIEHHLELGLDWGRGQMDHRFQAPTKWGHTEMCQPGEERDMIEMEEKVTRSYSGSKSCRRLTTNCITCYMQSITLLL